METNEARELIDSLCRYQSCTEQVDLKAERGQIFYLNLPDKLRDAIDSSPSRLHKNRPFLCYGVSQQKYLFLATKTIHDPSDITRYTNLVPYQNNGIRRAVVVDEALTISKEDFKSSKPTLFGSIDPWLFSLVELKYNMTFGLPWQLSDIMAEQLKMYIEYIDPSIQYDNSKREADVTISSLEEINNEVDNTRQVIVDSKNIYDTFEQARGMVINLIRSGKIKRGNFKTDPLKVRDGYGVFDDEKIIMNSDKFKKLVLMIDSSIDTNTKKFSRELGESGICTRNESSKQFLQRRLIKKSDVPIRYIEIPLREDDGISNHDSESDLQHC